ncbi:MAG: endolytic transglycosylase MltG [Elusimicrobiota bacterium]
MYKKIFIFILPGILLIYSLYIFSVPGEKKLITIPENATGTQIAQTLKDNGFIISKGVFLLLSDITNSTKKLKKGTYLLSPRMNSLRILSILRSGETYRQKITVPEGFTSKQIAELLEQKGLTRKNDFLEVVMRKKLEGYLFPETYFIESGMAVESIANTMYAEFLKRYSSEFIKRESEIRMNTKAVITLASIIEKEARDEKERFLISGIFHKRLNKRWLLESCATVRFALSKYTGELTYKDLKVNSPYNTYKYHGLPPGPICNPGLPSIRAALYPEQTDLMFFFTDGSKTHQFSRYYESHLKGQKKNAYSRSPR